jgi:hypothetical protein
MASSKNLTPAALQIFVNHYFSFAWLRNYLLKKRICLIVGNSDTLSLIQASDDLTFLTRLSYEGFPIPSILPVMFSILQAIEDDAYQHLSSELIDKFYFMAEIKTKVKCSTPPLSLLWKKVLTVSLEAQNQFRYYSEAKTKELALTGYGSETDLLAAFLNQELIDNWITADWKMRRSIEYQKTVANQIKYYESLSAEAFKKGNSVLCSYWKEVIDSEKQGKQTTDILLVAWSIQQGIESNIGEDILSETVAFLLENPENVPAIRKIIRTAADIEMCFTSFNKNFITGSKSFRITVLSCCVLFYQRFIEVFSIWEMKTENLVERAIEHMSETIDYYLFQNVEAYLGAARCKSRTLAEITDFPAFTEMIQEKFIQYENDLIAFFRGLLTKFADPDNKVLFSDSECATVQEQFPLLDHYPILFNSLCSFEDGLKICIQERSRKTEASWLYEKGANMICEFTSWFPQLAPLNINFIVPVISLLIKYSSVPDLLRSKGTIQILESFIESYLLFLRRCAKDHSPAFTLDFITGLVGKLSSIIEENRVISLNCFNNWKKIITLLTKGSAVDNIYIISITSEVIQDLMETGGSEKEQTVLTALRQYEQRNYFSCYLNLFTILLPEELETIGKLLRANHNISSSVNEHLRNLSQEALTKAFNGHKLKKLLIITLFRVLVAVSKQTVTTHWEEIIHYPEGAISEISSFYDYADFVGQLESNRMLTLFPQESLSMIFRHSAWTTEI